MEGGEEGGEEQGEEEERKRKGIEELQTHSSLSKPDTQIPTCGASMRVKAAGGRNKGAGWLSQSAFSIP